jgi:hypothetical protein
MNNIINEILNKKLTLIDRERFDCIIDLKQQVESHDGDIVECGVYKGGMAIFLAHLFPLKKIWVVDSFRGCQPLKNALFKYEKEERWKDGEFSASIEEVKNNFKKFNILDKNRIIYLEGWVKDTLPTCDINKILLLRVDVDSYSATREVLRYLYDKVVLNGVVVFDDTCCYEAMDAIKDFFIIEKQQPNINFYTAKHEKIDLLNIDSKNVPCGCYMIKKYE